MQESPSLPGRFPKRVYQLAEQHRLGIPITGHKSKMLYNHLVTGCILLLVSISLLIYALHAYFVDDPAFVAQATKIVNDCHGCPEYLHAYSSLVIHNTLESTKVMIFLGIFLVVGSLPQLLIAFFVRKVRLYVCEHGLLYINGKTEKWTRAMCWDEVTEVYWRGKNILQLCGPDRQKFNGISDMIGSKKISETVQQEVMPRLLARAIEQYERNGLVRLGSLCVQPAGLIQSSRFLPGIEDRPVIVWADIEDVSCKNDEFGLKIGGKWKYWGAGPGGAYNVANPTVCVALIRHILAAKGEYRS